MKIVGIIDEDFINYKSPCMVIEMPYCSFKCDKENGSQICQNGALACAPKFEMDNQQLIGRYLSNPISEAICLQGLEPFDSYDLEDFIYDFRERSNDLIIIYTGYTEDEVKKEFPWIYNIHNIVIKYGRFIPNESKYIDNVLGIELASSNQYAVYYQ